MDVGWYMAALLWSTGGSANGLSATDAWRSTQPVMLGRCARPAAELIREGLDTRQRLKVSKWNFGKIAP